MRNERGGAELPPMLEGGISDAEFIHRLSAFYSEVQVTKIRKQMAKATEYR